VSAQAAVALRSPGTVGPYFMLDAPQCSYGAQALKAGPQSGEDDDELDVPTTWTPAGVATNDEFEVTRVTSVEISADRPGQTILIEGTTKNAVASTTQALIYFDSTTATSPSPMLVNPMWSASKEQGRYSWSVEVTVPTEVADPTEDPNADHTWWVRLQRLDTNDFTGNDTAKPFDVEPDADPQDRCGEKNLGDFGMLDSPRTGTTEEKDAYALNTQFGLDHSIAIHPTPGAVGEECDPLSSSILDDDSISADAAANCVYIENGNKTAWVSLGLFGDYSARGPDGDEGPHKGLLREEATTQYCQDKGLPAHTTVGGYTDVNADTLECFLDGGSLEEASSSTYSGDPILAPDIFQSPRMMWVPLLNAEANPGNGYYPIVGFRPVFITEVGLNDGGSGVHTINVVALNQNALPKTVASSEVGIDYLGTGTKLLRLVE